MRKLFIILLPASMAITSLFGQNHAPVGVNDTLHSVSGYPNIIYSSTLLKNDFDPDGDSIYIYSVWGWQKINDTTWKSGVLYPSELYQYFDSIDYYNYTVKDVHGAYDTTRPKIVLYKRGYPRYDSINLNNINALISPFGNHFWDFNNSRFEVPKGSGKKAVFNSTVWIGGLKETNNLCLAAERYKQEGTDYFTGPISNLYDTTYTLKWNRVWKINQSEIDYHIHHWNQLGYTPIESIRTWPGNGNISLGQSRLIAPFHDANGDGIYAPYLGDYPLIRGDQALFFIYNDARSIHTETDGDPLGVEIHGMAYAFDRPDDSLLNNTVFFHNDISNLSATNYHDCYLGFFADFDLGFAFDDYLGCDVENGMMYCYNGLPVDGNGQSWAYGEHPPAIGLKVIGGPYMEPDGIDNPAGDCRFSVNGLNFGDNIPDNERLGMTGFIYFNNSLSGVASYMTDPRYAPEYYNLMKLLWKDATHLQFGGNGHPETGSVGPECNFMYPGNSDTLCNWGTQGILPNGGYNQNGLYWDETTAGNVPQDRRGTASIGPFNLSPGEVIPLDYCFTWARDYDGNNLSSVELLRERVTQSDVKWNEWIRLPEALISVPENTVNPLLKVYPNPSKGNIKIISPFESISDYLIYDLSGKPVLKGCLLKGVNSLDISGLASGFYIIKCAASVARIQKI